MEWKLFPAPALLSGPRCPLPAALRPDPAVLFPSCGAAMAKRSSLSIRIVEGKNLPAKDM